MDDDAFAPGKGVRVRDDHPEYPGRLGAVAEPCGPLDGLDLYVELDRAGRVGLFRSDLVPDPLGAATTVLAEVAAALRRARTLVGLVTVRQAIEAGDAAIDAAGLNPWAINEGLATGAEPLGTWRIDAALEGVAALAAAAGPGRAPAGD